MGVTASNRPRWRYPRRWSSRAISSTREHSAASSASGSSNRAKGPTSSARLSGRNPSLVVRCPFALAWRSSFRAGGQVAGIVLRHGGFEERLDLLAKGLVLGRCEPVPEPLAAQGDLDRLPRPLIGLGEGFGQPLAVVGEVAPNLLDHLLDPVACDLAGGLLGDTTQDLGAVLDDNLGHAAHDVGIKDMPHGQRRGLLVDQHRSLAREWPVCDVARPRQRSPSRRGRVAPIIFTPASHSSRVGRLFDHRTARMHALRHRYPALD